MNIDIRDRITLSDNNTYVVVGKSEYQGKIYYYLIEANSQSTYKFCYEKTGTDKLVEVEDAELTQQLVAIFAEQLKEFSNIKFPE